MAAGLGTRFFPRYSALLKMGETLMGRPGRGPYGEPAGCVAVWAWRAQAALGVSPPVLRRRQKRPPCLPLYMAASASLMSVAASAASVGASA